MKTSQSARQDARSEYLPEEHEANTERRKIFSLVPAQDDLTAVILRTRRLLLTDASLSDGAKVLFCFLLDWSLWPGKNKGPGILTISTKKLCELLCRSARAIWGWKQELLADDWIWITQHYLPNAYPMHTYHITAIHPFEVGGNLVTPDGLWGNGERKAVGKLQSPGARGSTQKHLKTGQRSILRSTKRHLSGGPDLQNPSENATGHSTKGHFPVADLATGHRTTCYGPPQNLLRATAELATGHRRTCYGPPHETTPAHSTKQHPLRETQGRGLSVSEGKGKGMTPPDEVFGEWIKGLDRYLPSGLERLKVQLTAKVRLAKTSTAKAEWQRRLEAVEERIVGPQVPDEPTDSKAGQVSVARAPEKPLTEAEILEGARYLVSIGKENLLTAAQRAVLEKKP